MILASAALVTLGFVLMGAGAPNFKHFIDEIETRFDVRSPIPMEYIGGYVENPPANKG